MKLDLKKLKLHLVLVVKYYLRQIACLVSLEVTSVTQLKKCITCCFYTIFIISLLKADLYDRQIMIRDLSYAFHYCIFYVGDFV
jgi:hypothetical protein